MPSSELAIPTGQEAEQRLPIGLLVKTGAPKEPNRPGRSLSHFRFDDGQEGQYAEAAAKTRKAYGDEPKALDEVLMLSNVVSDVLDIRVKAWSLSGLRIWGKTNFAALPRDEFLARWDAWDDEILYFPREAAEVPARLRDSWQGEPIEATLAGPDDPRIGKYEMHVEATLRFSLPRALGLGTVALYSTKSRHIARSMYESLWFAHRAFEGRLIGIPFRLSVRPRKTERFDKKERRKVATSVYTVVFDTPFTYQEAIEAVESQRRALGAGEPAERLALPAADSAFFRDDTRDQDEENAPPFIPVESFDPELRAGGDEEPVIEEGVYEEPVAEEPVSFEDMLPADVKKKRGRS